MLNIKLSLILLLTITFFSNPPSVSAITLFSDDFEDGDFSDWTVARNPCGSNWQILERNGSKKLGIAINHSTCVTEIYPNSWDSSQNNYLLETDMDFVSGTDKNLAFRFTDINSWYDLHFQTELTRTKVILQRVLNTNLYSNERFVDGMINGNTYHIGIKIVGEAIKVYVDNNLVIDYPDAGGRFPTGRIALQASVGADPISEVYFDNIVVSSVDSLFATPTLPPPPTPTPAEIPTPTPSPTPAPPLARKVVVIPGLGASWNADALLNCKIDNYAGNWTLAPYAADVYQSLFVSLLDNGFTPLPFYYDWRQQVADNAPTLKSFVDNSATAPEKIDLIGHSMGGLIGRAYLEQEAEQHQLYNLVTVGSPHRGAVSAYPAWSGGELLHDNLFQRIAITTLLRRCEKILGLGNSRETVHQFIPSTQNLLPVFDYLRDINTGLLKPVSSLRAQNNWLPTSFGPPFFGVTFGSLSGQGFNTLQAIDVKDRSRRDERNGDWEDGKPIGREMTTDGDGTVLTSSAQLAGADNRIVSQTHTGLVSSSEGIAQILDLLGVSGLSTLSAQSTEPTSALVVNGYPSFFWTSDENGKFRKDTDGIVAFTNPKKGKYKLVLQPKTSSTLMIVGQFLKNDRTIWKEYQLKNILPKLKTIDFDPENPHDDPLL